jgi:outer membrane protein
MKKILTVIVLVSVLFISSKAGAQIKIGYISVDNMVGLMPETAQLDSMLERFSNDSINPKYAALVSTYQYKDSVYRDSAHTPASVHQQIEQELPQYIYQIQNWSSISQQMTEAKQNEFLSPIYRRVYDAIKAVAKEKGYSHVFNKEAFLVAPEGDDMLLAVATKLKVKLPPPNTQTPPKLGVK